MPSSLSKILLPVDFSERAVGAARYAGMLARHYGAQLTLAHVLTPPHYEFGALEIGGSMLTELYGNRAAQVEKELYAFVEEDLRDLNVRRVVLEGDPARELVQFAHQDGTELIVMPTHGYGPFRRFILGSITAKVLHDADCPVWTGVHLEEAPPAGAISLRRILCAIDLGPQSCKALSWAAAMQAGFGAQLTVLHINTCLQDPRGEAADRDWRSDLERTAMEEIGRLSKSQGVTAELAIESGDPPKTICATAAAWKADLLVIGRGSAAGVFGRLRTNAYAIIRESPCPVLSV